MCALVTGVQTCALPISTWKRPTPRRATTSASKTRTAAATGSTAPPATGTCTGCSGEGQAMPQSSTPTPTYVPLEVARTFSFLRAGSHPEELVMAAAALGLPALAIADRNPLAGERQRAV